MSLSKLDKIFETFPDILGEFYSLQKKYLLADGLPIDLNPLLQWQIQEGSVGGINQHGFILVNPKLSGTSIYFSDPLIKMVPALYDVPDHTLTKEYLEYPRDFSIKLQMRNRFKDICLFSDETVSFTLSCGQLDLHGTWNEIYPNGPIEFICDYPTDDLLKIIKYVGLTLKVKIKQAGRIRKIYEDLCFFDKTLNDCCFLFLKMIKDPHFYETNFDHFNKNLVSFKIVEPSSSPLELFHKLNQLSSIDFYHLDFLDWSDLFLAFSFIKDHKNNSLEIRQALLDNINKLKQGHKIDCGRRRF